MTRMMMPRPPPLQPDDVATTPTNRFYIGLAVIALVIAGFAVAAWYNAGLKPSPATARCQNAPTQRACAACCRPDLYSWGFGFKNRCSCNVQTR